VPTATECLDSLECQDSVAAGMGILTSRERLSLEGFHVLPLGVGDSGPVPPAISLVPAPVTSLLPHLPEDDGPDDEPTGVLGTLKEMPVSEVVQTLAQGMKDALIEVKPKGEPVGTIGMVRGRVVFAEVAVQNGVTLVGEAAFQRLFCAHRGAFRIRYGRVPETRNIEKELTWLLLEAARVLDEKLKVQPVFDTPADGTPSLSMPTAGGLPAGLALDDALLDAALALDPLGGERVERTLIDPPPTPPPLTPAPPLPARKAKTSDGRPKKREPLPRTITPFSRFFDEAGVKTPPPIPLPAEAQRFQSLQLAEQLDDVDDIDRVDTDRTTPQRRTGPHPITP
jgi:hypothetical protein